MSPFRSFALVVVLPVTSLPAQEHAHGTEQLGRVVFPVTCNAPARTRFERAMAVLHSFWWEQGENAFRAVLAADSSCAMGWWGVAMNWWGNPFAGGPSGAALAAGRDAAERARTMGGKTSREAGFIAAASALYRDAERLPSAVRLRAYSDTLAGVHLAHPEDEEVAIYYALSLVATAPATDTTYARQKQAAALLNPLFVRHPDHPGLAHYIIHANDSPKLAHLGLDAARRYARIAPSAPHAQHMPSHIFVRLGMWDETIASNRKAFEAGVAYALAQRLGGVQGEQLHALDYAVYSYLQQGRDRDAHQAVKTADSLSTAALMATVVGGYNRTAMGLRIPLERGQWERAAAVPLPDRSALPMAAMLVRFARGIGAARSGNVGLGRLEVAALDSITKVFAARSEPDWARISEIKRQAVEAWVRFAAGDSAGGLALARAAAEQEDVTEKKAITPGELLPARELEADMHLAAGHFGAARAAYLKALEREPGRARSIFGAARAAELAGDRAAAAAGYRQFLELMQQSNGDRAEIAAAREFVAR